jgi:uncharacterized protein
MMEQRRDRPREPNSIASVEELICSWETPRTERKKSFARSSAGNINFGGVLGGTYAHIFSPHEPEFETALETAVRPLVLAAVREGRLITYTSCGGHLYSVDKACSECHFGVVPRSRTDLRRAWTAFKSAASKAAHELRVSTPKIYPWYLLDEGTERSIPVLDLYLHRRATATSSKYVEEVGLDATLFAGVLRLEFL